MLTNSLRQVTTLSRLLLLAGALVGLLFSQTLSRYVSSLNGLVKNSVAPAFMAWTVSGHVAVAGNEDDGHVRPFNDDGHQPLAAPEAGDNTKVVLRPIPNLVRGKNLDVVMILSG